MRANFRRLVWVAVAIAAPSACAIDAPRGNPFDPESTGETASGRIAGLVYVQGLDDFSNLRVLIFDSAEAPVDGGLVTGADGAFTSSELPVGAYRLEVEVPVGNVPIRRDAVEVVPGLTTELGLLTSLAEAPVGQINGLVLLEQSTEGLHNSRVLLRRLVGQVAETRVGYTDATGAYLFTDLPAGPYEIVGDRDGFTFDLKDVEVASPSRAGVTAPELHLYPATAVVRFSASGDGGQILGAPFTRSRDVSVALLPFGGINQMRLSESFDLREDGEEIGWLDHLAEIPWTLSAGEGQKTIYAQFRIYDDTNAVERVRTETYQTSIVRDASAPVLLELELAPGAFERNGVRYLTADDDVTSVPLAIVAFDPYSRLAGLKVVVEDADPSTVAYTSLDAPEATASYFSTVALTPTDGVKRVRVQLRDQAGNESELFETSVTIDTTPPVLLNDPPIVVRGAAGTQIRSSLVTLQFLVGGDDGLGIDGPVAARWGRGTTPLPGPMLPFFPETSVLISAVHGEAVQFWAVFADNAGNEVTATSPTYQMNLRGMISGRVLLEGIPETGANAFHDGTTIEVFAAGADLDSATPVTPSVLTAAAGSYFIDNVPAGSYQVRLRRPGAIPIVRSPVMVAAGEVTDIGTDRLILARGTLRGTVLKADLGPAANHGGIAVTALLGGRVMGASASDESGVVILSNLPVSDAYEIRISAEDYLSMTLLAVAVEQDVVLALNDAPLGCLADPENPPDPLPEPPPPPCDPLSLARLAGDFKICDRDDPAVDPADCSAILYTNKTQVLLGLDAENVTHVRYIKENSATPGVASFANPTAIPTADLCASPPAENCWNPFPLASDYLVNVSGAQAKVTVLVQFANNADVRSVGTSQVIFDTVDPLSPSISIAKGAAASVEGFTNNAEVALTLAATATLGPSDQASPLSSIRVSRDAFWDGNGTAGDREYSYGGTKLFTLDSATNGNKTAYAWFCDAAGNCTDPGSAVLDSIIYDTTPPNASREVTPVGVGVSVKQLATREWWTRSPVYAVDIDLGTSIWAGVAEVAAYRLSLSEQFIGAPWVDIDLDTYGPDDVVTVLGETLPPIDGEHLVYAEFKDAAGNTSTAEVADDRMALVLDTVPPGGTVSLAGGAAYVGNANIAVTLTTDAINGATKMQSTWTGLLPDPYTGSKVTYASSFNSTAPGADGDKTFTVRFFDDAGNFSERSDTVFLDTTPPAANAVASCDSCTYDTSGDPFYNNSLGELTFFLFAVDNSGLISRVEVVVDGDTVNKRILQYAPYVSTVVSTVAGPHTLQVTFFDPANNSRALPVFTVTHDRTAPTLSVSLNSAASWTRFPYVDIGITATDANEITELYVSNSATFGDATARAFTTTVPGWTVGSPSSDGEKHVYVRVVDAAGNSFSAEDTINVDQTAPTVTASLSGAAAGGTSTSITNSNTVAVNVTGADPGASLASGLSQVRVSNSPEFADSGWLAYPATISSHTLASTSVDGPKTVYIWLRDVAGNIVDTSASITLDKTAPQLGSLAFIEGSVTTGTSVTLTIGQSGATQMRLTGGLTVPTPNTWMTLTPQTPVTLTAGDGSKNITVELRDDAGNASAPASRVASIVLDTNATGRPTVGTITVTGTDRNGPSTVNTRTAAVSIALASFADNVGGSGLTHFMISESNVFSGGIWEACPPAGCNITTSRALSSGDGNKILYAKVKDAAGNESNTATSNTLRLDTTPPTVSVSLQGTVAGATTSTQFTRLTAITVLPSATDGGSGVSPATGLLQVSASSDFSAATWVALGNTAFTLGSGDGQKRVYVRVRDLAGNETIADGSIILDQTAPYLASVLIDGGADYTSAVTGRTLNLAATDALSGVTEMRIGNSSGAGTYEPYASIKTPYSLSAGAGTKFVYVTFRDAAGNASTEVDDRITADLTQPDVPTISVAGFSGTCTPGNEHWVTSTGVILTLAGTDDVGIDSFKVAEDGNFGAAAWIPWTTAYRFGLSSGDGQKNVHLKVRDVVGRERDSALSCVTLDTTPPVNVDVQPYLDAGCTQPAPGGWYSGGTFYLGISGEDEAVNSSLAYMRLLDNTDVDSVTSGSTPFYDSQNTGTTSHYYNTAAPLMPYDSCLLGTFGTGATNETLTVYLRDEAGNWAPGRSVGVKRDSTDPTLPVLTTVAGGNRSATIYWNASTDGESGISSYDISYSRSQPTAGSATVISVPASPQQYTITGLDNRARYNFQIRARDVSGRASPYSAARSAAIGWVRNNVVSSSTHTLIPFGVAFYEGIYYVGYMQMETVWGESATTLHIAVSRDSGATWSTETIDGIEQAGRQTANLYAGPSGLVVTGTRDADSGSGPNDFNHRMARWISADQGSSWSRIYLDTDPDAGGSLAPTPVDPVAGSALTREGGAMVTFWQANGDDDVYVARSVDNGKNWAAASRTEPVAGSIIGLGACNTQHAIPWYYLSSGGDLTLMYSYSLGYTSFPSQTVTGTNVRHSTIACSNRIDPGNAVDGAAYSVWIRSGVFGLYMRHTQDPSSGSWTSADVLIRSGGVDFLYRPAIYASGLTTTDTLFVSYRDTGGDVWFGSSTAPMTGSASFAWMEADTTGDVGVNLTMGGTAEGSPVLAYTDGAGRQLYLLHTALPAPNLRTVAADTALALSWSVLDEDALYELSYGTDINAMTSSTVTPLTSYYTESETATYFYEVQGRDTYGQVGEPGFHWQVADFTPDTLGSISSASSGGSRNGTYVTSGSNQWIMPPLGHNVTLGTCNNINYTCVFSSTNGGADFTEDVPFSTASAPSHRDMTVAPNAVAANRIHVVATNFISPNYSIQYRSKDPAGWNATTTLYSANAATSTDKRYVQVSANGAYVVVAWVDSYSSSATFERVRYMYNSNYGTAGSWSSIFSTADLGVSPVELTIVSHIGTELVLSWVNSTTTTGAVQVTRVSNITTGTFSAIQTISDPYDDSVLEDPFTVAAFTRGSRYNDNFLIAFGGRRDGNFLSPTAEDTDTLYAFVGGRSAYSFDYTDQAWGLVQIDNEEVLNGSLATDVTASGMYIAYATQRTLFGVTTRQLKIAYCQNACAGRDNWVISTVKIDGDPSTTIDFRGILMDVEPTTHQINLAASEDGTTDYYRLRNGGTWRRVR